MFCPFTLSKKFKDTFNKILHEIIKIDIVNALKYIRPLIGATTIFNLHSILISILIGLLLMKKPIIFYIGKDKYLVN